MKNVNFPGKKSVFFVFLCHYEDNDKEDMVMIVLYAFLKGKK